MVARFANCSIPRARIIGIPEIKGIAAHSYRSSDARLVEGTREFDQKALCYWRWLSVAGVQNRNLGKSFFSLNLSFVFPCELRLSGYVLSWYGKYILYNNEF